MRAVNLLPGAPRRGGRRSQAATPARALVPVGIVAGVLLIGGLTWWGVSARQDASERAEQITRTTASRDALRLELADFRALAYEDGLRQARRGAVVSLAAGRTDWERLVRDVATVLPAGVWLTALEGTTDPAPAGDTASAGGAAGGGASTLSIDGVARGGQARVASTMVRLGSVAGLGEPRLVSSESEGIGDRRVVRFSIETTVDRRAQSRATLMPVVAEGTP